MNNRQFEANDTDSTAISAEGTRLSTVPDGDRSTTAGRPEHGPSGLHPGWRPEKVHKCEGEYQLPIL